MKKIRKGIEDDELKIISCSFQRLLDLDEKEKKIHRAQKKEIGNIKSIMDRLCDDKDIKEKIAKNEEVSSLLLQAKDLISTLRSLLK